MSSVSVYDAKNNLSSLIKQVQNQGDVVEITKYDKPVAVLLSKEEFEKKQKAEDSFFQKLKNWHLKYTGFEDVSEVFEISRQNELTDNRKIPFIDY